MRGVLNAEGYFALVWLLGMFARSRGEEGFGIEWRGRWWMLLLAAAPFLAFLSFPFLADDYSHILHARALTWAGVPALFTVPASDHFFRPLGYLSYALDAQWAGLSPTLWRLSGLALHMVNTLLVYRLCRELGVASLPALFGACLFAIHGSRPEAVTWVAARFDLLCVLFGLATLLFCLRGKRWMAAACLLAAVLSKESAFVVPLLAVAVLWYLRREMVPTVAPLFGVAALVFAYRWVLLGGVGGYRNAASGSPTVFDFKFTSTLQALFPRFWGTLLFPLNWTVAPDFLLTAFFFLAGISLVLMLWAKPSRRLLGLGVMFAYVCALPVHQFLSIGADLEKSRVLYFASIGLAIFFAALITSKPFLVPAVCILVFQVLLLEHNLRIWKDVGYRAQQACVAGARDLPNVVDGVYFLHTGYPECLSFPK